MYLVNETRTIYPHGLNEGFSSKFCVGSRVQQETPEEGQKKHQPKHCEYNNKDDNDSQNTLNDKNYEASSQKFRQIMNFNATFNYEKVPHHYTGLKKKKKKKKRLILRLSN